MEQVPAHFGEALTASAEPAPPPPMPPDARTALDEALGRRRAIVKEVSAHIAAINRLAALEAGHADASAALAAFDAAEAATIRRWAAEPSDAPPPQPRAEERAQLVEALKVAEQRGNAAQAARQAAEAEVLALNGTIAPITNRINAHRLVLLLERTEPLIERARDAMLQLERDVIDLGALEAVFHDEVDRARQDGNPAEPDMRSALVSLQQSALFIAPWLAGMRAAIPVRKAHWVAALENITKETNDDHHL